MLSCWSGIRITDNHKLHWGTKFSPSSCWSTSSKSLRLSVAWLARNATDSLRQTDRQTDKLMAILCPPSRAEQLHWEAEFSPSSCWSTFSKSLRLSVAWLARNTTDSLRQTDRQTSWWQYSAPLAGQSNYTEKLSSHQVDVGRPSQKVSDCQWHDLQGTPPHLVVKCLPVSSEPSVSLASVQRTGPQTACQSWHLSVAKQYITADVFTT